MQMSNLYPANLLVPEWKHVQRAGVQANRTRLVLDFTEQTH